VICNDRFQFSGKLTIHSGKISYIKLVWAFNRTTC
jgi:hypothetical protein